MNHIKRLQQENADLRAALAAFEANAQAFQIHLGSAKFTGTENGERKDWIATGDVLSWLRETRSAIAAKVEAHPFA